MEGTTTALAQLSPRGVSMARGRAPYLGIDNLVAIMEQALGAGKLLQVTKGSPLVLGWDLFTKDFKMTDDIVEKNQDLLKALNLVNPTGIWKKTQLQIAFDTLDTTIGLGLVHSHGKSWSEQASMLIMQAFIHLRTKQKNCHTGARYPLWMKNLLAGLSKEGGGRPLSQ